MRFLAVILEHITYPIIREIQIMSNTLQTQITSLTDVVSQLQSDVQTAVTKLSSISNVSAGDTITPEQESAIQSAVATLQSMHASLSGAEAPATTPSVSSGATTVSGATSA